MPGMSFWLQRLGARGREDGCASSSGQLANEDMEPSGTALNRIEKDRKSFPQEPQEDGHGKYEGR